MGFTHGKTTVVLLGGADISQFTNNTDWEKSADTHDVTCYGKNSKVFKGGLKDGKATLSGVYDDTAAGPHDIINPIVGTNVALVYRPEGTGVGKPQETVDCTVKSYSQSSPVGDFVKWKAEVQFSDDITSINQ
jgi:ABC-type Fe3+/spermidine/putrescine transport system ATPase subunit